MINISIESFKLLLNEINQIENKNSFIIIREDTLLSKGASNEDRGSARECWKQVLGGGGGGARSMTGGAGQLIVNMTKTGCYYYYFIWIIKSLYRRISNVYEECGSIIARLAYCMGALMQLFLFYFFSCGKSLYSRHFWMCFLSSHAVSVNGAPHNNEPAHRHKK